MEEPVNKGRWVGGVLRLVGKALVPHPIRCPQPLLPDSYPQWEEAPCRWEWVGCPAPRCHPGPVG